MYSLIPSLALLLDARAATLEVPDDFPTAQQAVNAAANNDTIRFNDLVAEDFTVTNKTLTFTSTTYEGWRGIMTVNGGANVTLDGLKLTGGEFTSDPELIEIGIYCQSLTASAVVATNATVNVTNSEFNCYGAGAVITDNTDLTITNSLFEYNYDYGAVHHTGGELLIDGSTFQYNAGSANGGAVSTQGTNSEIRDSYFYANSTSLGDGGALYAASDVVLITASTFNNNYNLIWYIPGLIISDPNDLLSVGTDVAGLAVGIGDGAGVYIENPPLGEGDVKVHDNTFCGNLGDRGAGLFIDDVPGVVVRNNRFAENWSMHFGGGMYITAHRAWEGAEQAEITNNTFLLNTAGLIPPPYPALITVIGGGGTAAFEGTIVDFRNNITALSEFGGGIMGLDGPDYTIGDLITMDYNIFYHNCDEDGCSETSPETWQNFTGDLNQISLSSTNLQLAPFPTYFGGGDFNCYPDAFYPEWNSPAVRNGDVNLPNIYSPQFSDIGSYGGPEANVLDRDGDSFENIYDCNDEPVVGLAVFPGAPEVCDTYDNNCDGLIDEGFDTNWYPDNDGDGFGDVNAVQPEVTCAPPANHVLNRDDCDDADPDVNPGRQEICDGLDNDCDYSPDGGLPFIPLWKDLDGDAYGAGEQYNGCSAQDANEGPNSYYITIPGEDPFLAVSGYVPNDTDCNDFSANVSPAATEVCDDLDNDCNGLTDDAREGGTLYYLDEDNDGYGSGAGEYACTPPNEMAVTAGGDCDEQNVEINPSVDEVCDGIDNDCDGTADKDAADAPLLFEDLDNDGYGNPSTASRDCAPGPSYTANNGLDCDDNDPLQGECAQCGCQAAPTPASAGMLAVALGLVLGARRRRS
jgi:MYXO-CTERM domain-containing protein